MPFYTPLESQCMHWDAIAGFNAHSIALKNGDGIIDLPSSDQHLRRTAHTIGSLKESQIAITIIIHQCRVIRNAGFHSTRTVARVTNV